MNYWRKNRICQGGTREQNLSSQEDALNNAWSIRIFTDNISGKEFKREGLTAIAADALIGFTLGKRMGHPIIGKNVRVYQNITIIGNVK